MFRAVIKQRDSFTHAYCFFFYWCSTDKSLKDARVSHTKTFFKPPYFDLVQSEYEATRERVALIDYSSFTKLEITSPGWHFSTSQVANDNDFLLLRLLLLHKQIMEKISPA